MNTFITGCSSGIGEALVRESVRRGDRVWGIARREPLLKALQQDLDSDHFHGMVCDMADREQIHRVGQAMDQAGFRPDRIILNAATNPEGTGTPYSLSLLENVVRVNLIGTLAWVDLFLPTFLAQKRGQFVLISSLAAFRGDGRTIAYAGTKAALSRAFEAFRGQHAGSGVQFTTLYLGAVQTGMGAVSRSPFRLTPVRSAQRILAAAEARVNQMTIPRYLRLMLEILRIFPDTAFSKIIRRSFPKRAIPS